MSVCTCLSIGREKQEYKERKTETESSDLTKNSILKNMSRQSSIQQVLFLRSTQHCNSLFLMSYALISRKQCLLTIA